MAVVVCIGVTVVGIVTGVVAAGAVVVAAGTVVVVGAGAFVVVTDVVVVEAGAVVVGTGRAVVGTADVIDGVGDVAVASDVVAVASVEVVSVLPVVAAGSVKYGKTDVWFVGVSPGCVTPKRFPGFTHPESPASNTSPARTATHRIHILFLRRHFIAMVLFSVIYLQAIMPRLPPVEEICVRTTPCRKGTQSCDYGWYSSSKEIRQGACCDRRASGGGGVRQSPYIVVR